MYFDSFLSYFSLIVRRTIEIEILLAVSGVFLMASLGTPFLSFYKVIMSIHLHLTKPILPESKEELLWKKFHK